MRVFCQATCILRPLIAGNSGFNFSKCNILEDFFVVAFDLKETCYPLSRLSLNDQRPGGLRIHVA